MKRIALTFDYEWCPLPVYDWLAGELATRDVRATFFATDHPHPDYAEHEVALHPNAFREGATSPEDEIKRLLDMFPQARGVRMHCLYWHGRMEQSVADLGLEYASTHLIPNQQLDPFYTGALVHFPIFYMEYLEVRDPHCFTQPFTIDTLNMHRDGIYVFCFHPNLIYTNTPSEKYYREVICPHYQNAKELNTRRFDGRGSLTMFEELLALNTKSGYEFVTLAQVVDELQSQEVTCL